MVAQPPEVPPAQRPAEAPQGLPRDTGPVRLYAGAVRYLAARTAHLLLGTGLRLHHWATTADCAPDAPQPPTGGRVLTLTPRSTP